MKKVIEFEGMYWWSDAENVISALNEELKEALSEVRVSSIKIIGTDFNDGRQGRKVEMDVRLNDNKIIIEKDYQ